MSEQTLNISFDLAMAMLRNGQKVKLPEWTGYWFTTPGGKVLVFTRTGDVLETPHFDTYKDRNDWMLTDGSLGFDFAILALKAGKSVRLKYWGADVLLTLQVPDEHSKMSHPYIYVTSRFGRVPWVATQVEMLATDWEVVV